MACVRVMDAFELQAHAKRVCTLVISLCVPGVQHPKASLSTCPESGLQTHVFDTESGDVCAWVSRQTTFFSTQLLCLLGKVLSEQAYERPLYVL